MPDPWDDILAGNIPELPLEARVKEAFSLSPREERENVLKQRLNDLHYAFGAKGKILYRGTEEKLARFTTPEGAIYKKGKVDVVDTDQELGDPIGIRVEGGGDILLKDDPELMEAMDKLEGQRKALINEIAEKGGAIGSLPRLKASAKTTPEGWLGNLQEQFGKDRVIALRNDDGEIENAIILRPGQDPQLADIKGKLEVADFADVAGDVGEMILAPLATTGLGVLAARRGAPIGGAAAVGLEAAGDVAANVARQGISGLTGGEDYPGETFLESLPARAGQAALTGAGGAAGSVVGRGVGKLAKKMSLSARSRLGERVLSELEKPTPLSIEPKKAGTFLAEAEEAERAIAEITGERVGLSPGQATGAKKLLQKEHSLAQFEETADIMQTQQRARINRTASALDALVGQVAKDPDALGKEAVGGTVADAISRHAASIRATRSKVTAPLYEAAEQQIGKSVPTRGILETASRLIDDFELEPDIANKLRQVVGQIESAADGPAGNISVKDINKHLKYWTKVAGGELAPFEKMDKRAQRRVAHIMLKSLDDAMEAVGEGAPKEAVETLRAARSGWRTYSQQLDELNTRLSKKILGLDADASDEAVVDAIMKAPAQQVRGLFATLSKTPAGEAAVQQMRARALLETLEKGGKLAVTEPFGEKLTTIAITPRKMVEALGSNSKMLETLFADQPVMRNRLRMLVRMFDRLGQGPGLLGAQTAYKQADVAMLKELQKKGLLKQISETGKDIGGKLLSAAGSASRLTLSAADYAHLMSTPEGIEALYALANSRVNPYLPRAAEKGVRALAHLMTILNRESILSEHEANE